MDNKGIYKLYLAKGKNTPQGSIVGDFKKRDDNGFICEIYLSDAEVGKAGCFDIVTTVYTGKSAIYVTSDMLEALQEGGVEERFELYHELGHIHCGHYESGVEDDGGQPDEQRLLNEEKEADAFAASEIGGQTALEALRSMLTIRAQVDKRLGVNGTPESVKAIREIRARIDALK